LKKHLLLISWLMLLTLTSFAETPTTSKTQQKSESETVLPNFKKIDWAEALPMLAPEEAIALGEIVDQSIDQSFALGYKQASLRYAPELEYWKTEAQSGKDRFWDGFQWGFGSGAIVTIGLTAVGITLIEAVFR